MLTRETLLAACWRLRGNHRGCYRHPCAACGAWFYAGRPDARYCRAACRQRAYRRRRRARSADAGKKIDFGPNRT